MKNCFVQYGADHSGKSQDRSGYFHKENQHSSPGALLLHLNPSSLYRWFPCRAVNLTVLYTAVPDQSSKGNFPAVPNKPRSHTRTAMFTKTGNQEFGSLTLLQH